MNYPISPLVDKILFAKEQTPSPPFVKGKLSNADTSAVEQETGILFIGQKAGDCEEEGIIMEIRYSEKADKQIKKICNGDRKSAKMIIN
ncbi:MAG: hypothetical protein A2W77_07680 [Nitrospinae bacterium RIFCSPLOWO2_12_39_16]|nr:MAG: hypothetical protein A2W77_07680 [Nitrospinae bacterium RIFCSPLOWO2_12_39_16]